METLPVFHLPVILAPPFFKKCISVAAVFCCLICGLFAQSQIDSMENALSTATGKKKAELLYLLSWEYRFTDKDKALRFGQEGLQLAKELKDTVAIAGSLNSISETWLNFGDFDMAEKITAEELPFARFIPNPKCLLGALTRLGTIYYRRGKFDDALVYQLEVLKESEKIKKPEFTGVASLNLGLTYMDLKRYDEALQYFQTALTAFQSIHHVVGMGACYINIAETLQNQKKYREALEVSFKAEEVLKSSGNKLHLCYIYTIMGKLYKETGNNQKRLEYFQKALSLGEENKDDFMIASNQAGLGRTLMEAGDMLRSKQYFDASLQLAVKMQQKSMILEDYAHLRDWYLLKQDFAQAKVYDEKYNAGMDSLFNVKMAEKVADSETKYETQKKEAAIRELENQNRIRNIINYSALAGILALLVVLWLSRRTYRQRRLLQQVTIDRLESERKVVALNAHLEGQQRERLRIAEDLHDDFGSGLSKISLLSEVVKKKATASGELDKIAATAKELLLKMSEVVWALNHHNDTLPSLAAYIRRYTSGFFEDSGVRCHFNIPDLPEVPLSGETRRNVFLVIKEALHNVLKHAEANKVDINISIAGSDIRIDIRDNGKGFAEEARKKAGNGLLNMQKRMSASGGTFEVLDTSGKGASIRLTLPVAGVESSAVAVQAA